MYWRGAFTKGLLILALLSAEGVSFEFEMPVVVVGAGACGLTAALAAHDAGQEVLILERDENPQGSTSLSAGLIPAACTKLQQAAGIDDSVALFAQDIVDKAKGKTSSEMAHVAARTSGPMIDWLIESHGVPVELW